MKPAVSSRKKAVILGVLVGGVAFWWYLKPFPWLGVVIGLFAGLFTFFILNARRMERLRRPFFIGLFVLVLTTLIANILYMGFNAFMKWIVQWDTGYYILGAESGTSPFPLPILIPTILYRKAEFITESSVWHTSVPTSLDMFFFFMAPYFITLLVLERSFCGWLCPLGGLPEAMVTGNKERWRLNFLMKKSTTTDGFSLMGLSVLKGWVGWVQYGILIVVILLSFQVPFSIVNVITPALWLKSLPVFWTGVGVIIVFAVVLPFMTKRRTWCHTICPVGATLSLLHKISLFRIKIDKVKCNKCMDCVKECRSYAMTPQGVERGAPMSGNCTRCGRCIEACPEEAIDISWLGNGKVRAPFIALVIAWAFTWYLWFVVLLVSYASKISHVTGL